MDKYDENGNRTDSLAHQSGTTVMLSGPEFDHQFEVQTDKIRVSTLIQTGGLASATGTIPSGTTQMVTLTFSPKVFKNANMCIPFMAIYDGTSAIAGNQVYPSNGGSIAGTKWTMWSGFDYAVWQANAAGTAATNYVVSMYNNSADPGTIFINAQVKFIQNNAGTT